MMEMYSQRGKTDTEQKYNLVPLSALTLGSNPSSATITPATLLCHSAPQFSY